MIFLYYSEKTYYYFKLLNKLKFSMECLTKLKYAIVKSNSIEVNQIWNVCYNQNMDLNFLICLIWPKTALIFKISEINIKDNYFVLIFSSLKNIFNTLLANCLFVLKCVNILKWINDKNSALTAIKFKKIESICYTWLY